MRILPAAVALFVLTNLACHSDQAPKIDPCPPDTLTRLQSVLDYLDSESPRTDTALARAEAALPGIQTCQSAAADSLAADICHKTGNLLLGEDRFPEARAYFTRGLQLRQRIFSYPHRDMLRLYHNIGVTHAYEKNYRVALAYFDSAGALTPTSMPTPYIPNLIETGRAYLKLGELNIAERYFTNAHAAMQTDTEQTYAWKLPELYMSESDCLRKLSRYAAAIQAAQAGLATFPPGNLYIDDYRTQTGLYLNLGNAWQDSMQHCRTAPCRAQARDRAIEHTRRALRQYEELNDPSYIAQAARNLGELLRRTGRYDEADRTLGRAIGLLRSDSSNYPLFAELYINRGETRLDREKNAPPPRAFQAALSDFDSALYYLTPTHRVGSGALPAAAAPVANRADLLLLLSDLAGAYLERHNARKDMADLAKAQEVYDTLLQVANRLRADFMSTDAKLGLVAETQQHLRQAFDVCLRLSAAGANADAYRRRAFRIAEQSKAIALLEAARLQHSGLQLPENLRERERALERRQADILREMFLARDNPQAMQTLERQRLAAFEAIRKFRQDTLEKQFAGYRTLRLAGAELSVDSLQQGLLAPNQGLLEYFFRDSVLDIFLVTPRQFVHRSVPVQQPEFTALADSLRWMLADSLRGSSEQALCRLSHTMYRTVMAPVDSFLPERLVVIPDAPLHELPFEALLRRPLDGGLDVQVREQNFLVFRHAFSYCFSANLLWVMQRSALPEGLRAELAALAPGFPPRLGGGGQVLPRPLEAALSTLDPIKNAEEVSAIAGQAPCHTFVADQATKEQFFDACRRYQAVHVSTHGILINQDPNFNFIAFHQPDSVVRQDQLLFLNELFAESMPLELVVFSACVTARGKYLKGEGNMSMARGLAQAGVKSFITTLWPVVPDYNRKLMPNFYAAMGGEGREKDLALAEAKRAFIRQSRAQWHPASWAGPILIGASNRLTLEEPGGDGTWHWWALAALAAAAAGFWRYWRKKRRG